MITIISPTGLMVEIGRTDLNIKALEISKEQYDCLFEEWHLPKAIGLTDLKQEGGDRDNHL